MNWEDPYEEIRSAYGKKFKEEHPIIFDIEHFGNDIGLYLDIPYYPPLLLWNPSIVHVRIFMQKANIDPRCLVYGMFWDLFKYKCSLEWLDLVINKKEDKRCTKNYG